jgi:hypothetical protein
LIVELPLIAHGIFFAEESLGLRARQLHVLWM